MLYPRGKSMLALLPAVAAVAIAGCGSSSSSSSAGGGSQSSSSAAPASSASGGNGYGPTSASSTPASATRAVITTKHSKLGTVLALGPKNLTVYLFEADHGNTSSCSGRCAVAWPPVLGTPSAHGATRGSQLGTIKRADGRTQVTYAGHPLYLFVKDKDSGDAYGEAVRAFGAEWYVLAPSGHKIDRS
jgi:predicted lipoprotein with Yx(FWY)xxD motif